MNLLDPSVGLVWVTEHLAGLIEKSVFLIFFLVRCILGLVISKRRGGFILGCFIEADADAAWQPGF